MHLYLFSTTRVKKVELVLLFILFKVGRHVIDLLSHLLVAGCDIGVRFSVRPSVSPSVRQSVRPSVNIYVDVRHLFQS